MIKDIIIVALLVQIGIDILSAKAVGRRLNQIEDKNFNEGSENLSKINREINRLYKYGDYETAQRDKMVHYIFKIMHDRDQRSRQRAHGLERRVHVLENKNRV